MNRIVRPTDEDKEEFISLVNDGYSVSALARYYRVSRSTIMNRHKEWGIRINDQTADVLREQRERSKQVVKMIETMSVKQIAAHFVVPPSTIYADLNRAGIHRGGLENGYLYPDCPLSKVLTRFGRVKTGEESTQIITYLGAPKWIMVPVETWEEKTGEKICKED